MSEQKMKQTEIGLIPEDWGMKKFFDVANICRGASPRPIEDTKWFDGNSDIGWVRISDVTKSHKYLYSTQQNLSKEGIKNSRFVSRGNLIMSMCATVGRPIILKKNVCIHDGFAVFYDLCLNVDYFYYYLSFIEKNWSKNGQTGSQMNLNTNIIGNEIITFPLILKEQKAIAKVLADSDDLIEQLDKLIVKKENVKQGVMQELLTGKRRLDGFDGEWEVDSFDNLIEINKGKQLNKSELTSKGEYPAWNGGIRPSGYTSKWNTQKNTITISEGGNSCGFVNYCKEKFWCGGHCYALSLKKDNSSKSFFFFLLKYNEAKIMALRIGSGLPNIQKKNLKELELFVSSDLKEQEAIVNIISDMDLEIEELKQKKDKYQKLKVGMMQELLIGRIRLV